MIEVKNLCKTFKIYEKQIGIKGAIKGLFHRESVEKHALKDINFTINPGEIVGLIGSNGAGKTTLMKIMAGIIPSTSGEVSILGYNPWFRENDYRRQIGLIMGQKNQLWWDLPAGDCFLLLKEIYQISDQEFQATLDYLIATTGVQNQLKTQIRQLSLGERMKMEIIAAMLHKPKVIFLDEPTIGLDITAQRSIREFILEYTAAYKPMVILTSHYMEDIENLCQRMIILANGQIVKDGSMQEIVERFAQEKELIFQMQELSEQDLQNIKLKFAHLTTQIVDTNKNGFTFLAKNESVSEIIAHAVSMFKISDIKINEPDISQIVEKLMQNK